MSIKEKVATAVKGVFATSDGFATTLAYGKDQNPQAGPLFDLTGYLSAMPPLPAMAPSDYEIRKRDFRLAENLDYIPGSGKFPLLRSIADRWNVLRVIIDTKKDLVATVPWSIKLEPEEGQTDEEVKAAQASDPIVEQLTNFFRRPDAEKTWFMWIKELLEETYVLDAGCIEVVRDSKGKVCKIVVVAGDTINRVIDDRGWTPSVPQRDERDGKMKYPVAYQQVLSGAGTGSEGVPQRNLSVADMLYCMRNPRPGQKWGQCHSADTEVLSRTRGFVLFRDLFSDEPVATRNYRGEFEWQIPTAHINEWYEGEMYAFTSRSMDMLVTPNHRMLVSMAKAGTSHNGVERNEKIMLAEEFAKGLNTERKIPVTSVWESGEEIPTTQFDSEDGRPFMVSGDDYCALMGAYLAEGNLRNSGGIEINQSEEGNGYELYRSLFERINGGSGYNGRAFVLARNPVGNHFKQFGLSAEKYIPDALLNAPKRQLQIFWDYYMAGDGCVQDKPNTSGRGKAGLSFQTSNTVSRRLSDGLVEIAQKLGFSVSVSVRPPRTQHIPGNARPSECKAIYVQYARYSDQMAVNAEKVWYEGTIHCVSVPNGVLLTRRNGKLAWSGNSSVEKIATYAMTGIYADQFVKDYYTSGNQPPGIMVLSGMPPERVEEYEKKWNAVYAGNLATRRRIAMISAGPGDQKNVQYIPTKEPLLKSDIYLDFIRFACAEFSLPSVPFERPMNRASAKEAGEQAEEAGLVPDLTWLAEIINVIIKSPLYFNQPNYTFTFGERRSVNAVDAAAVDKIYVGGAMETINEARKKIGLPPSDEKNADKLGSMTPNAGWVPLNSEDNIALQSKLTAAKPKPAAPGGAPASGSASASKPSVKKKAADAEDEGDEAEN